MTGAYPTKPIRVIIPFPPGDSLDTLSRLILPAHTTQLGLTVIAESPNALAQAIKSDHENYSKRIKSIGFRPPISNISNCF